MHPFLINTQIWGLPLVVPTYPLLAVAGMIATGGVFGLLLKGFREKPFEHILFLGIILLSGVLGARLGGFLTGFATGFFDSMSWYGVLTTSGSTISAGVVTGGAALLIYARFDRQNLLTWQSVDALAAAFPFGHALGRIGCFLGGCCYGRVCDSCGLTITYPTDWLIPRGLGVELAHGPRIASPLIAMLQHLKQR